MVVELALDPEIAGVVDGEEGFVGRAGGRGALDAEEDRGGLRVFRIPEVEARGEMSIVSPDSRGEMSIVSPDSPRFK